MKVAPVRCVNGFFGGRGGVRENADVGGGIDALTRIATGEAYEETRARRSVSSRRELSASLASKMSARS